MWTDPATPRAHKLIIKGKLLQLLLPCEVKPDNASAVRSQVRAGLQVPHACVVELLPVDSTQHLGGCSRSLHATEDRLLLLPLLAGASRSVGGWW